MYSVGEEFEIVIDDIPEYFTCLATISMRGKEYIIGESETGEKKAFLFDSNEDELIVLDEEENDEVILFWEDEYMGTDKDYMYWNEDYEEYNNKEEKKDIEYDDMEIIPIDEDVEEELEDFIETLFE